MIVTDEELELEMKNESDTKNLVVPDIVADTEDDLKKDIPSNYIEVVLASNGRIEGIPKKLHFRCYSASDALDLNVADEDKSKAVVKVLTRLNYEHFDIGLLTVEDVLYILYKLHATFISSSITRKVYIDDTIKDDDSLNDDANLEEVDIPISSMVYAYLGKDYDDKDITPKIKVPFKIKDNTTKEEFKFKLSTMNDIIFAESYCRNYFKDEFIKFGAIRTAINKIHLIKDEDKQDEELEKYMIEHEREAEEYYEFTREFAGMVAKIVQAETIVSYNGKELKTLDDKWDVYANKIGFSVWSSYNDVLSKYPFGIKDEVDVFIPSLRKKVHRRVGFQFDDFLHIDRHENTDRCSVEFD